MGIVSHRSGDGAPFQAETVGKAQPDMPRIVMAFKHSRFQDVALRIADRFPVADRRFQMQLGGQQLGLADTDDPEPLTRLRRNFKVFHPYRRHVHGPDRSLQHRLALPQQLAVFHYHRAAFHHMHRLEGLQILKHCDVCRIPRRQGAHLFQPVAFRNIQRRHGDQVFRIVTLGHTDLQQVVNAALFDQVVRVPVIAA